MDIYQFLFDINPRAVWPGLLAIGLMLAAALVLKPLARRFGSPLLLSCARVCLAVIFVAFAAEFALGGAYLFFPSYLDHAEAHVAAVAWLNWRGFPLYPPLDGGDMYGVPYGPYVYQVYGFLLWLLGPSIVSSKLSGLLLFAVGQAAGFVALTRAGAKGVEAVAIVAVECFIEAAFTDQAYVFGVRGDVILYLVAQLALLAGMGRGLASGVALGLLGAVALNLKIHGALYVLPSFAFYIGQLESGRVRAVVVSVGAGMIFAAMPFLLPDVSAAQYIYYLRSVGGAPMLRWIFEENLAFAGTLLLPPLCIWIAFRPRMPNGLIWFACAAIPAMVVVAIIASVEGAGPHHLLPFLPAMAWSFVTIRRAADGGHEESAILLSASALVGLVLGYGPLVMISWIRTVQAYANAPIAREATDEIERALTDNPHRIVAVGPGSVGKFDAARLRVIPVLRGNPLPLDPSAWTNFQHQGMSDALVEAIFRSCRADLWLLPHDHPLIAAGLYSGQEEMFSDEIRAVFRENYTLEAVGKVYDQWRCRHQS